MFQQPGPIESAPTASPASDRMLSMLAAYSTTLTEDGKRMVRDTVPVADQAAFDLSVKIAQDREALDGAMRQRRVIEAELKRADDDEAVAVAIAEHKRQKLIDSGADGKLAASFAARCFTSDTLDEIEVPDPLIEGFMDKASLVRIFGPSNSLKSFVALDMAGCVSAGLDWHGNETHRGRTLLVAAEGPSGAVKRIRAWEKQNGHRFEAVLYPHAVQIADQKAMAELVAYATTGRFEFVVFDTQARCTVGIDENSNTEMGTVVASLDALKTATGACVMLVHHSGSDNAQRARGATAIYAAMDGEFKVERKGLNITLETTKRKDGRQAEPLDLTAVENTVSVKVCKAYPDGVTTSLALASGHVSGVGGSGEVLSVPELTTGQKATLVALARYDGHGAGPTVLAEEQGLSKDGRKTVAKNLARLITLDCVKKAGSRYEINDRGWAVLGHSGLTTGYRTVAPLDGDEDA